MPGLLRSWQSDAFGQACLSRRVRYEWYSDIGWCSDIDSFALRRAWLMAVRDPTLLAAARPHCGDWSHIDGGRVGGLAAVSGLCTRKRRFRGVAMVEPFPPNPDGDRSGDRADAMQDLIGNFTVERMAGPVWFCRFGSHDRAGHRLPVR
jgi:hypothetical protein